MTIAHDIMLLFKTFDIFLWKICAVSTLCVCLPLRNSKRGAALKIPHSHSMTLVHFILIQNQNWSLNSSARSSNLKLELVKVDQKFYWNEIYLYYLFFKKDKFIIHHFVPPSPYTQHQWSTVKLCVALGTQFLNFSLWELEIN